MTRAGVFVTGTDTGVGKTFVAACLVARWQAEYWKPVQTGPAWEHDGPMIVSLAGIPAERIHPSRHSFPAPLSPEAAARHAGSRVDLGDFTLPDSSLPLVVEGAGGVLVPLGNGASMADLMVRLGLPVLLVARSTLGTINHTLLSLEALRTRKLSLAGVVLVGPEPDENAEAICRLGGIPILARLPQLDRVTPAGVAEAARLLPSFATLAGLGAQHTGQWQP